MAGSFVAIDFETANSFRGSACEIGVVRVVDGEVDGTFESLIHPHADHADFDFMNVAIHGIRSSDVTDAPEFGELWPHLRDFVGDLPLVAHNAAFDTRVLRESFDLYSIPTPAMTYFCTLVLSRRMLQLVSYSLPFVAKDLGVAIQGHHRALADARCSAQIALALIERGEQQDLESLATSLRVAAGYFDRQGWGGAHFMGDRSSQSGKLSTADIERMRESIAASGVDREGELAGRRIAFTGGLSSMTRAEAAARVLAAGGEPQVNVTKRTDFLVVGMEGGYTIDPTTAVTAKFDKAERLRAAGSSIEIIDEFTFATML